MAQFAQAGSLKGRCIIVWAHSQKRRSQWVLAETEGCIMCFLQWDLSSKWSFDVGISHCFIVFLSNCWRIGWAACTGWMKDANFGVGTVFCRMISLNIYFYSASWQHMNDSLNAFELFYCSFPADTNTNSHTFRLKREKMKCKCHLRLQTKMCTTQKYEMTFKYRTCF